MSAHFGVLIDTDVLQPEQVAPADFVEHVLKLASVADQAGVDGIYLPDRHMRQTTLAPDQLVNAAAIGAITKHAQIGTYCSVLPLYHPMHYAEGWAHIDQLTRGRAVVAIGAGYSRDYMRAFGLAREGYWQRFVEAAHVLRRAWTTAGRWSYSGEIFQLDEVEVLPGPFQAGGPPIWVAGQGQRAFEFANGFADGIAGDPFPVDTGVWLQRATRFLQSAAERGVVQPDIAMLRHVFLSESDAEASQVANEVCLPHLKYYERAGLLKDRLAPETPVDEALAMRTAIAGPAATCAERLADFVTEHHVTYLILKIMRPSWLEPKRELDMTHRVGAELLPLIRRFLCST